MNILVVAARLCYPLDGGAKIRAYHLLRALAERHNVTMLTYYGDRSEEKYFPHFKEMGVTLVPIYSSVVDSGIGLNAAGRAVLLGLPLTVAKYYSRRMAEAIAAHLNNGVDCIHCEHLHMFSMIPRTDRPVVLDAHNVESQIAERYASAEGNLLKKAVLAWNGRRMRQYETNAVRSSSLVLAVSEDDRNKFAEMASVQNCRVVENGVDIGYFAPQPVANDRSLVFVGSMDWRPNNEGMLWFLDEIWPLIRQKAPDVSCVVVGKKPSGELMRLGRSLSGVTITGAVDDVRPYVARAALSIVPLRIGGGTRLKVLEAFAMSKAVVSTSLGCEGIACRHGEHILISDDAAGFADAAVRLLRDRSLNERLGANARRLVETHYSWGTIGEKYLAALESL